jgi:hypothetical protein
LKVVEQVLSKADAPYSLRQQARQWKKSLEDWSKSESSRSGEGHLKTEEGYYAEALKLFAEAKQMQQYPADRNADVLYLRATSLLHQMLAAFPQGKRVPEGLLLLGTSYDVLRGLQIPELHEALYVSCVHKAPHSQIAEKCYQQFEESVIFGYTGSGGFSLPPEVEKQLRDLRAEALPQESKISKPQ